MTLTAPTIPDALAALSPEQIISLACRANPAVWAERRLGFTNSPIHREWYAVAMAESRCALLAPRDHSKTQVITVNITAWSCVYKPGYWTQIFAATLTQAKAMKARIDAAVGLAAPHLLLGATTNNKTESVYANGSMVTVAGAGSATRGGHPDRIVGDDVLKESAALSASARKLISDWWFGSVSGMASSESIRIVGGVRYRYPATVLHLVGTPFHEKDLLMSMRANELYHYRRYKATFRPDQLVPGTLAVEVS